MPSPWSSLNGVGRRLLDRVGDPQQAGGLAVDQHEDDRLALAPQGLGALG